MSQASLYHLIVQASDPSQLEKVAPGHLCQRDHSGDSKVRFLL